MGVDFGYRGLALPAMSVKLVYEAMKLAKKYFSLLAA
jgi:hypothetical protein